MSHTSLCLVLAALSLCSCAAHGEDDLGRVERAVVNGTADQDDPAALAILHRLPKDHAPPRLAFCSGALLAPNVVLTAAHCVADEHDGPYDVFFGAQVAAGGVVIPVEAVLVHSAYDAATHRFDAALLRLASDSTSSPYRLEPNVAGLLEIGDYVRAVGFGVDDALDGFPETKRSGAMAIAEVEEDIFSSSPAPAMTCTGDSGGPVLATDRGGEERLVGLTVFGDAGCKEQAINQRIDALNEFIVPFIERARAPRAGCSFDHQSMPSNGPLIAAFAVAVLYMRRRRSSSRGVRSQRRTRHFSQRCGRNWMRPRRATGACRTTQKRSGGLLR
jgi:secreted trypsin-like serine protease